MALGSTIRMPTISPPPSKRRKLSGSRNPPEVPLADSITVYSYNVNGIQPFLQRSITSFFGMDGDSSRHEDAPKASLRDLLRRHDWPTMLFLQEIKVSNSDEASKRAIERAVSVSSSSIEIEPSYVAHLCLPSDNFNARGFGGKLYGVCSIIRKDVSDEIVDRVRLVDWDREGRFMVIETKSTEHRPRLAFINAYMVNGTDRPYRGTPSGEVTGTRHDRKLQVHRLLAAECRDLEAKGFGVILAGDMNVARSALDGYPKLRMFPPQHSLNRADFEAKFFSDTGTSEAEQDRSPTIDTRHTDDSSHPGLGMIDTFRFLHPSKKAYTYYPRGKPFGESCDRVDMIIISASLRDNLVEAGMHETPGDRGPSDHVPLFARVTFNSTLAKQATNEVP
ncbi:hypothetical protein LTR08_000128 [Meristemomyces frigidus]|nr:hypothetical protein LTR08_000128 [Meristemomyces frigidus]